MAQNNYGLMNNIPVEDSDIPGQEYALRQDPTRKPDIVNGMNG
jgi:hypothetical protein